MFWQEDNKTQKSGEPEVMDVSFKANADCMPVDHAYALYKAVTQILPWIRTEPYSAIHLIYGPESGNGWERPADSSSLLYLPRRSRFAVRVPKSKSEEVIEQLDGTKLDVAGYVLRLEKPHIKELSTINTVYARNVVIDSKATEDEFLTSIVNELKPLGIAVKKIMCGKTHVLEYPPVGELHTKSVMLTDLDIQDSLKLQTNGVGEYQFLGCGVFLPYKTVENIPGVI